MSYSTSKVVFDIDINNFQSYTDFMDEVKEMLKTVINGQHVLRAEMNAKFAKLGKKLDNEVRSVRQDMREGFGEVNKRLDILGKQLSYLEDDAPTREEHDALEKRVEKIEKHLKN